MVRQCRNFSSFSVGLFFPWASVASEYCNIDVIYSTLYTVIRMRYLQDAKPITLAANISILCMSISIECLFISFKITESIGPALTFFNDKII